MMLKTWKDLVSMGFNVFEMPVNILEFWRSSCCWPDIYVWPSVRETQLLLWLLTAASSPLRP